MAQHKPETPPHLRRADISGLADDVPWEHSQNPADFLEFSGTLA
jgi:hypothetical protein